MNLTTIEDMIDNGQPYHLGFLANLRWFFGGKFQFLFPGILGFGSRAEGLVKGLVYYNKLRDLSKLKEKIVVKRGQKILVGPREDDGEIGLDELLRREKEKFGHKDKQKLIYLYDGKQFKDSELN